MNPETKSSSPFAKWNRVPAATRATLAALLLLLSLLPASAQTLNKLYIMDNNQDNELLYIIEFNNPFDVVNSTINIGSSISMDTQLAADYRDIHVLTDGSLVVESISGNRLSYWSATGTYDSVKGEFGGATSNGLTPLYNGTFLSKNTGTNNDYKIFNNGQTTAAYSGQLFQDDGTTDVTSTAKQLAARAGGGFIIAQASATTNVFTSTGDSLNADLTAVTTADMSPDPTDNRPFAAFSGGWAGRATAANWYAYSETVNISGDFPGTLVSGTVGGRIVDIASFGLDHTAALFMHTSFADTTNGNAYIQIWDNSDLAGGPVRTIDLGFNLNTASQNWNNSAMTGPMVIPEPGSALLVLLGMGGLLARRNAHRAAQGA